jgi:hypothetical protein
VVWVDQKLGSLTHLALGTCRRGEGRQRSLCVVHYAQFIVHVQWYLVFINLIVYSCKVVALQHLVVVVGL